ncbi:MAG: PLP-dependent aminotransferase family protein [Defluviitaleaceae bacterium]|nr:PLP-dependent aminotransferase family protein [Defluviitaleaceae bacterium]
MTKPKYRQLADALLSKIESGALPSDTRLPPIRILAKEHGVNNTTAVSAYKYLESIGRAYSRMGSGTYVSKSLPQASEIGVIQKDYINLAGSDTDAEHFPADAFGRCIDEILKTQGRTAFSKTIESDTQSLHETLAGINNVETGQITLLTDIQQGLDIIKGIGTKIRIEEDMYGDFYYDGLPRQPLRETDGSIAYIKSYAKIFLPGLAYMVVPKTLAGKITAPIHCPASAFLQRAFGLFLREGGFDEHAANMRIIYGKRYRKLIAAARVYLSDYASFDEPKSGLAIRIYPKKMDGDEIDGLCRRVLQRKVVVSPILSRRGERPCFKLSFATVREESIAEGIGIIAAVMAEGGR